MRSKDSKVEITEQSAWNLSQYLVFQINDWIRAGARHFRRGNAEECFFDFGEIRILIHTDINSKEDKHLDNLEEDVKKAKINLHRELMKGKGSISIQKLNYLKEKHYVAINRYRKYMMELLGKYGYLVSKKEDTGKLAF